MDHVAADFRAPDVIGDPYPLMARLRAEDPAHYNPRLQAWCLTRFEDVDRAFKDLRLSSDRIRPFVSGQSQADPADVAVLGDCLSLWMVFNDAPMHTRLRALVNQAFSRRAVEALRPVIAGLVHDLIDALPDGEIDLIRSVAYPLPAQVIATMLGVPREDVDALKQWSDDLASFVLASRLNPDKYRVAAASLGAMNAYFARLIDTRRRAPGERIIDSLIAAHEGEDRLGRDELIASCVLLLFAGHETTTHFIANGIRALALHPDQMAALVTRHKDAAFLRNALNELLRWDGPSLSQLRVLDADIALHGATLRRGERVYLMIAGANRDERVFDQPDRLDLARPNAAKQLAFGAGVHLCLGAHLARLEGEVAFPILLDRLRGLRLAAPQADWTDSLIIRGMQALPVRCDAIAVRGDLSHA